ncbi:multidrug effflux MFS transporter [Bradyrhizobium oligotrophicum]|uniref:multidrug effflux MFS transporter n=1 Tax=Bradyrhizobium oligotrophicum TaxID=44255 RepID=UPI0005A855C2|nr:multidrug effflux MFS transporter [Bradyrhizobium oligotrophicum]
MHGMISRPLVAAPQRETPSRMVLILLVVMTGLAPISLYLLVPALPMLATTFDRDASVVQMTVSFYMAGIAISQLLLGPLSDRFGRRPVMLAGLSLSIVASVSCIFAATLPQLIAARFFQALGGASGMVISRAIIRDLYPRERIGAMISLVVAVMMIAQMLSPLTGGLIEIALGWHAIFYVVAALSIAIAAAVTLALPETRPARVEGASFRRDIAMLVKSRAFLGYMLCQVLASQIIFAFAGGGPYIVEVQMGRSSAEYGAWFATTGFAYFVGNLFCVRYAPRHSLDRLIWFGLVLQLTSAALNFAWSIFGFNQVPSVLFGTQMLLMFANAAVMANSAAGAISVRPGAAGTASGAMGFLQMGVGALTSQLGAWLGGHFGSTLPLTSAMLTLSLACACSMIFLVPRTQMKVTKELIETAEEDEAGVM